MRFVSVTGTAASIVYFSSKAQKMSLFFLTRLPVIVYRGVRSIAPLNRTLQLHNLVLKQ